MLTLEQAEIARHVNSRIESLRRDLLDFSRRNPLISTQFSPRSNSHVRVVDELPDVLFSNLRAQKAMRLIPLPSLEKDPKDEETADFQTALSIARKTNDNYIEATSALDPHADNVRDIERELRDRVREALSMPPRQTKSDLSLEQHARNNGIVPFYDLPNPSARDDGEEKHIDNDIQTLLLPVNLIRKMNGLTSKSRSWINETGVNVLHTAFGFVEWSDAESSDRFFSPLVLLPSSIEKTRTGTGYEFRINGADEGPHGNFVLSERLSKEYGISLPAYQGGSIEDYMETIEQIGPQNIHLRVRRQIAIGVFPSARIAMYHDLDTNQFDFSQCELVKRILYGGDRSGTGLFADEYDVDDFDIEARVPHLVMNADSSQFSAMVDVAGGKSVALEGPPGTGKSQTIVNTIANALGEGKKVLFVASKKAALDVVSSRLEKVKLGDFVLPLQADRASKKNVIESIKTRMNTHVSRHATHIAGKLEEFRSIRAKLAKYIDIISEEFEQTGSSVFEILGWSIRTFEHLGKERRSLITLPLLSDIGSWNRDRIERIKSLGKNVEDAWRQLSDCGPHWGGQYLPSLNWHLREEIADLTQRAAQAYAEADNQYKNLEKFKFSKGLRVNSLREADCLLCELPSLSEDDVRVTVRICRDDMRGEASQFVNDCKRFRRERTFLDKHLVNLESPDWKDRLQATQECLSSFKLASLDIAQIHEVIKRDRETLEDWERISDSLKQLAQSVPVIADIPLDVLRNAREIISNTPLKVLKLRNSNTVDPAAVDILERVISEGRKLQVFRQDLEQYISVSIDYSVGTLAAHVAALRRAGLFSRMGAGYRNAKNAYLSHSRRKSFDRQIAANDIQQLIELKVRTKQYCDDSKIKAIFGNFFNGIDTDFDGFESLAKYLETVSIVFPNVKHRRVKEFLNTSDVDSLLSLPEIDAGIEFDNIAKLADAIRNLKEQVGANIRIVESVEEVAKHYRFSQQISSTLLIEIVESHKRLDSLASTLSRNVAMQILLQERFSGAETEIEALEVCLEVAEISLNKTILEPVLVYLLESGLVAEARRALSEAIEGEEAANVKLRVLSEKGVDVDRLCRGVERNALANYLLEASENADDLQRHSDFGSVRQELAEEGFGKIVDYLLDAGEPLDGLPDILEAVVAQRLAQRVYEVHGRVLNYYHRETLNALRGKLASLDKQIMELSADKLRSEIYGKANPPAGIRRGQKRNWSENSLLEHVIDNPRSRFAAPRELIRKSQRALLEYKPCWMMSPLAVAQYLPKHDIQFDLCIIDEASQMPPEEAIGALVRSRRVMVVGDTNQLPPTNFFRRMLQDDDWDDDAEDEGEATTEESILEIANSEFRPKRRLRWHYRSKHSGLISFSNQFIYDNDLIVFPAPDEESRDKGVSLVKVEGNYKSGTNSNEAERMVQEAVSFMKNPANRNRSLAIVTVNQKQMQIIEEMVDFQRVKEPTVARYIENWERKNDGLDTFIIKNLENIQGDERDVIFVGTVYGPDRPDAPMPQRFGPISGIAGKRRLNVLFTRAREQIVTFTSMLPSDIRADEHGNPGAYMLRRWLEYSASGDIHTSGESRGSPDTPFEEYVIDQIRSMGCEAISQVGVEGYFIDIGVRHPEWPYGYLMGVECDGATYHSARSARDRDRLRQEVLEGLGWHLHRIWSTAWFNDPRSEADRLRRAIQERLDDLKSQDRSSDAPEETEGFSASSDNGDAPEWYEDAPTAGESAEPLDDALPPKRARASSAVQIGDTVRVRHLTGDRATLEVTISDSVDRPDRGIIHVSKPLAAALLEAEAEEGDEIEVLIGSYVRRVIVERVTKLIPGLE